jgi:S1-C subfamily serine protease
MRGNALDLALLLLAGVFGYVGYRRGFVLGTLSFVGFLGGAVVGLQAAPLVAEHVENSRARLMLAVAIALGLALVGQVGALYLGARLRAQIRSHSARVVDGVGGSTVSVLAVFLVAWMVATPLAQSPSPWMASQVRHSTLLRGVDAIVPDPVRNAYDSFESAVNDSAFPEIFHGLAPTDVRPVPAPDPRLAGSPVVDRVHDSVVKVSGDARECNRRSTGTGFVIAPERVITNAHVVAGTEDVRIELYDSRYRATVVLFDPETDVAVLRVPGLEAPVLPFAGEAPERGDAIVVGYPLDGPYTAVSARLRQREPIKGPDIYEEKTVERDVYAIRSEVRPGNSGGPLLSPEGEVYGVIFAAAADDPETGFALTADQVAPAVDEGSSARAEVGVGDCHH